MESLGPLRPFKGPPLKVTTKNRAATPRLDYPVSITSSIAAAFMATEAEVNESMGLGAVGWWDGGMVGSLRPKISGKSSHNFWYIATNRY